MDTKKEAGRKASVQSKGDRLGWGYISEEKKVSLRGRISEGRKVNVKVVKNASTGKFYIP